MKTKINFHARWPHISGQGAVLIYDRHLDSICPGFIRKFPLRYAVSGGEGLKDAARFFAHMERLAKITAKADLPRPRIIAMGGGSVGDFSGFVASVWKRGTPLVHIPSTWLAAMDSAHGGKTALNLSGIKNQIGTFYSAESVHLIQPLLLAQPEARAQEASGELFKMALLSGGDLWKLVRSLRAVRGKDLWPLLPRVIAEKMRIVARDPFEKTGERHVLNLGHSMGHVFESLVKLPHGSAVGIGLVFATEWSYQLGIMKTKSYREISSSPLWQTFLCHPDFARCFTLSEKKVWNCLSGDKKRTRGGKLRFIYVSSPGRPLIREVRVGDVVAEYRRQAGLPRGHM